MKNILNFRSFFKFISRNKAYTAINLIGLSISLMFVILISIYTVQELSTDKYHEKGDRIFMLASESSSGTALPIGDRLKDRYPEIEAVCPIVTNWLDPQQRIDGKNVNGKILFAEKNFFDIFSFPLIAGNKETVLDANNYAVISERFAKKVFGNENPIGKSIEIQFRENRSYIINGVAKDIKNSIIGYADIFLPVDNITYGNPSINRESLGNAGSVALFVLTKEGTNIQSKEADATAYFKEIFWLYQRDHLKEVYFIPLKDAYFSGEGRGATPSTRFGDYSFVVLFISIGVLILLFAVINYVNLTVAQSGFRAKEMATRRLMGSSRGELFVKMILESIFITAVSFLIALLLAWAVVPYVERLLNVNLFFADVFTPLNVLIGVVLILSIGTIAGLLPAVINSRANPIEVVRGTFRRKTKMTFSRVFITFQNIITISFIAASVTVLMQFKHLISAPLGYNTTNVLDIMVTQRTEDMQKFVNEVRRLPQVKRAGMSAGTPLNGGNNWTMVVNERNVSMQQLVFEKEVAEMLGITVLHDNHSTAKNGWFLTEYAFKQFGIDEQTPSFTPQGSDPIPILGTVKDIQLRTILEEKHPLMVRIYDTYDQNFDPWNVLIEVEGDIFTARNEIAKTYQRLFDVEMTAEYLDAAIEQEFVVQKRISIIVSIFTVIAIVISLLGLLAMSTYFIQQRVSEIAVRKVFGSTEAQVLKKLIGVFLSYVGIAFVIAVPIIWYVMNDWLSGYSYRIALSPWIFVAAGLFCLAISFVTVFSQSYRAANANPVENIRAK